VENVGIDEDPDGKIQKYEMGCGEKYGLLKDLYTLRAMNLGS
jgi:hypothetical protein